MYATDFVCVQVVNSWCVFHWHGEGIMQDFFFFFFFFLSVTFMSVKFVYRKRLILRKVFPLNLNVKDANNSPDFIVQAP